MNIDQQLLRRYERGGVLPIPIKTSAPALSLETKLEKIDPDGPRVELSFVIGQDFVQAEDVVHGGAVATMLDFAMAYAALLAIPDGLSVATININISCLRSATPGQFKAIGEIERCGRSTVFARAQLLNRDNKTVATAVSSLAIVTPRRKGAVDLVDGTTTRAE